MKRYITASLETHLFFGRIMKEHALFLQAGFPAGETAYRNKADWYRSEFEKILRWTVRLADGMIGFCGDRVALAKRSVHGIYGHGRAADSRINKDSD